MTTFTKEPSRDNGEGTGQSLPEEAESFVWKKFADGVCLRMRLFVPEGHSAHAFAPAVMFFYGGMWSVAFTDFLQMGIIIAGLIAVAVVAGNMAGGVGHVVSFAQSRDLFHVLPEMTLHGWLFWISAAMTMMIGSIPQQDVFQRVMSAEDEKTATRGPILGGCFYILFAFVPMFDFSVLL